VGRLEEGLILIKKTMDNLQQALEWKMEEKYFKGGA